MSIEQLNYRSLRRDGHVFTLIPASMEGKSRHLCDKCFIRACDVRELHERYSNTEVEVRRCAEFVPGIGFQDPSGLIDGCNTMRLGKAWSERVTEGDMIGLIDVTNGEIFGEATVSSVAVGEPAPVLSRHSRKNHLFIERRIGRTKAAEAMAKMLPNIYGNLIWKNAKAITAIYLTDIYIWRKK